MDLTIGIVVFLASATVVVYFGVQLAIYGDALAELTGWGRLFVGSLLVAMATSLPELATNISAVRLETPNPELAVSTVIGANMLNMWKLSLVALLFGGMAFLSRVSSEQSYLVVVSVVITGTALVFGAVKIDIEIWQIGLASWILLLLFVGGNWWVFSNRPKEDDEGDGETAEKSAITLKKAWIRFGIASAFVVVGGIFLAWSADEIALESGVASSTIGIVAVAFVTSLPELSMAIAAARIGAADLAVAGLYGSNVFNMTILFFADPFYRDGILINQTVPSHFLAGIIAISLMFAGAALFLWRDRLSRVAIKAGLTVMLVAGIVAAVGVATLGAQEEEDDHASATAVVSLPPPK